MGKRLDSIEDVASTNAKIRDDIHNRLNNLYSQFERFSEDELKKRHALQSKIEGPARKIALPIIEVVVAEHDARMILFEEKSSSLQEGLRGNRSEITKLDARCEPLENSVNLLRADITAMEREMTRTENHLQELQSFKESTQADSVMQDKRLTDLETDGRIERLEQLIPQVQNIEEAIKIQNEANKQNIDSTASKARCLLYFLRVST